MSFGYLLGWQLALLVAVAVMLHEAGHAAAMRMVGIEVRGIYLIPFFGGCAVPMTSYRSDGHLAFVALMGPAFSLVPTVCLAAMFPATGDVRFLQAASLFAVLNASNLLPIYPLDGGLIVNSLLGSVSRNLARVTGWIGVLAGLAIAVYWQSFLIGIPFLLFAVQRYLGGSRTIALDRVSFAGGSVLALASVATVGLYLAVLNYCGTAPAVRAASGLTTPDEVVLYVHSDAHIDRTGRRLP